MLGRPKPKDIVKDLLFLSHKTQHNVLIIGYCSIHRQSNLNLDKLGQLEPYSNADNCSSLNGSHFMHELW